MQQDAEMNDAARRARDERDERDERDGREEGEGGLGRKGAAEELQPPAFLRQMNKDVYLKDDANLSERIATSKGHVERE